MMMDSIFDCATAICLSVVVCSLVRMLVPTGNTQRIISVVLGVFTMMSIIAPVYDLVSSVEISNSEYESRIEIGEYQNKIDNAVLAQTGEYINQYVSSLMSSSDCDIDKMETNVAINDKGEIYIKEINLYINSFTATESDKATDIVYDTLNIKPNILVRNNDE